MHLKHAFFVSLCLLFVLLLSGCSTPVQMPDANTPAIVLKEAQTRGLTVAGTITVPAGVYAPDFEADNAIYYRAPTHLVSKALGITSLMRGGIVIPNPFTEKEKADIEAEKSKPKRDPTIINHNFASMPKPVRDLRQGVWYDQQEGSGGLLIYAATSPKRIFHVEEPFNFEVQTNHIP